MKYLIVVTTPEGSAWSHSEDGGFGRTLYTKEEALERAAALNRLDVDFRYEARRVA